MTVVKYIGLIKHIRISKDVHSRLALLKTKLAIDRGRKVTFNDVIKYLLDKYERRI